MLIYLKHTVLRQFEASGGYFRYLRAIFPHKNL